MADRYGTAVLFSLEKNVYVLSARAVYGSLGSVSLDPLNSKGFCAMNPDSLYFTGNTVGSSATMSSVSNFTGLYVGMTLSGPGLPAGATISSISASAGNITLSTGTGVSSSPGQNVVASGGRYRIQFGTQAAVRLDTYNKIMSFNSEFREIVGSASGTFNTQALFPAATDCFIVQNNIGIRTIPQTLTSGSTDASVVIQLGYYGATNSIFTAVNPQAGEAQHLLFVMGNSTTI